jgi:thermitase
LPDADIDAPEAWRLAHGHRDIVIAVLDSGIDATHPEFEGRILPGLDFVDEDADPTADHPHGPFVTGLIAANAGNGIGIAGVDHAASVLPVKVLNRDNRGTVSDLVQGLLYAAGADVINLSLVNYGASETLEAALRYARDAGSTIVACAGNGGIGDADRSAGIPSVGNRCGRDRRVR